MVCGRFLVVCGGLRLFAGGLWWFVIVASFSNYDFWEPSVRELLKNTNEDTPIAIAMNNDTGIFLL